MTESLAQLNPAQLERVWEGLGRERVGMKHEGFYINYRCVKVEASTEAVYRVLTSMGGRNGWPFANWLWQLRGRLDKSMGGVGRREQKSSEGRATLKQGDTLDYYRVERIEPSRLLRLFSELRAPGEGWMEWRVEALPNNCSTLVQTAFFAPRGLARVFILGAARPTARLHLSRADQGHQAAQRGACMKTALIILLSSLFLLGVVLLPLPLPAYLDFQVIYHADLGLLRGIPVYDHVGQVNMIAHLANVQPDQVYVLPFPYPPWYALATLWLALLPIGFAVRLWFGLNVLMLFAAVWLMTEGLSGFKRLISFLPAFLFLPALGTLLVGQYVFPVLLGAALWVYAVEKEKPVLIALACALLTFKPHLGALILLASLIYLVLRKDAFGTRALIYTFVAGVLLAALGFLADPAWPLNYFHSLLAFGQVHGVTTCGQCTSLPAVIARLVNPQSGLALAPFIGLLIFIAIATWWGLTRRSIVRDPTQFLTLSVMIVLLISPYLLNYDFVLLLLPLFILIKQNRAPLGFLLIATAYLLPLITLDVLGRQGNNAFIISTLLLLAMFYRSTATTVPQATEHTRGTAFSK